jgi:hypothetical protein
MSEKYWTGPGNGERAFPDSDHFPSDALEQYLPQLCQRIAGYHVFSPEYYCFMVDYPQANHRFPIIPFYRQLLGELKADLLAMASKKYQPLRRVDGFIIANAKHNHPILKDVRGRLAENGKTIAWYDPSATEPSAIEEKDNIVNVGRHHLLTPPSLLDFLFLWLSLPWIFVKAAVISFKIHRAYRTIANVTVRLPVVRFVLHLMALQRCCLSMKRLCPKEILLGFDFEIVAGAIAIAGHKQNARITVLQHGVLNPIQADSMATTIACWTEDSCRYVEELQKSSRMHRIPKIKTETVGTVHMNTPLPLLLGRKTILLLNQWHSRTYWQWGKRCTTAVCNWLNYLQTRVQGAEWCVRSHPNANDSDCPGSGWTKTDLTKDLKDDVAKATVVLTMNSTAGVEAGAMGRPVIFMWSPEIMWFNSMTQLKELFVCSPQELASRVNLLLSDEEFYKSYADKCVSLCRTYLGFPKKAADSLVSMVINDQ